MMVSVDPEETILPQKLVNLTSLKKSDSKSMLDISTGKLCDGLIRKTDVYEEGIQDGLYYYESKELKYTQWSVIGQVVKRTSSRFMSQRY